MLKAFPKTQCSGFSLVELMITIVVVSILVSLGMPSFLQMLRNAEIRNAAESVANGLQRARAEGVARNANVSFALGAASSWTVRVVSDASIVDQRVYTEGSSNVTVAAFKDDGTTAAATATFNNLGQRVVNADASATLGRVNLAAVSGNQNLRVIIEAGGNAKVCDPSLVANSSPRACPP